MGQSKRVTRNHRVFVLSVFWNKSHVCSDKHPLFPRYFPGTCRQGRGWEGGREGEASRSYPTTSAVLPFYTSFIFQISSFYWVYVFENLNCTRGNQMRDLRKNVPKQSAADWTFIHLQSAPHIAGFPQAPYARPLTPSTPPLCQLGTVPRPQPTGSWQLARLKVTCGATLSSKNCFTMAARVGHEHVWELLVVHWTKNLETTVLEIAFQLSILWNPWQVKVQYARQTVSLQTEIFQKYKPNIHYQNLFTHGDLLYKATDTFF